MSPPHACLLRAAVMLVVLAAIAGCSRSALEPFDPAPAPSPTLVTDPPTDEPFVLPLCQPIDESLVFEAPPPVPCADPPIATTTTVQQVTDVGGWLMLASDQCSKTVVGSVDSGDVRLAWSIDGAQSFGDPIVLGPGIGPFLILDGLGAAHAFFAHDLTLAHVVLDGPSAVATSELIAQPGKPAIAGMEPIVHRSAAARGPDEVAWTWETFAEPKGVWFASTRVKGTNSKPIPIHGAPGAWSTPRLCLAGRDRVVIVWRAQSHGQQVLSAISDDGGASFCITPIGTESSHGYTIGESVDIACAPDGRAVAVWDGEDGVRVAALSRAGVWSMGDSLPSDEPYYPHIWNAGDRVLVTWIGWGQSFGYGLVDFAGKLVDPPVWAPDLNLDGKPDRFIRACSRDDGVVLLTQGRFSHSNSQATGPAVMTFLDVNATVTQSEEIALYGATGIDVALACQPTGAVAIWWDASVATLARWVQ